MGLNRLKIFKCNKKKLVTIHSSKFRTHPTLEESGEGMHVRSIHPSKLNIPPQLYTPRREGRMKACCPQVILWNIHISSSIDVPPSPFEMWKKREERSKALKPNDHPHPLRSIFIHLLEGIGERKHVTTVHSSQLHLLRNYYKHGLKEEQKGWTHGQKTYSFNYRHLLGRSSNHLGGGFVLAKSTLQPRKATMHVGHSNKNVPYILPQCSLHTACVFLYRQNRCLTANFQSYLQILILYCWDLCPPIATWAAKAHAMCPT